MKRSGSARSKSSTRTHSFSCAPNSIDACSHAAPPIVSHAAQPEPQSADLIPETGPCHFRRRLRNSDTALVFKFRFQLDQAPTANQSLLRVDCIEMTSPLLSTLDLPLAARRMAESSQPAARMRLLDPRKHAAVTRSRAARVPYLSCANAGAAAGLRLPAPAGPLALSVSGTLASWSLASHPMRSLGRRGICQRPARAGSRPQVVFKLAACQCVPANNPPGAHASGRQTMGRQPESPRKGARRRARVHCQPLGRALMTVTTTAF
jgi:hypothetical protein